MTGIDDEEQGRKKDRDGKTVFEEIFVKLEKVERENKILNDENMTLKLGNFYLRDELCDLVNKDLHEEPNLVKVPKIGSQSRFQISQQKTEIIFLHPLFPKIVFLL